MKDDAIGELPVIPVKDRTLYDRLVELEKEVLVLRLLMEEIGEEKINSLRPVSVLPVVLELVKIRAQAEKTIQSMRIDMGDVGCFLNSLRKRTM